MNSFRRFGPILATAALLGAHGAAVQAQGVAAPVQGTALAAVPLNSADIEFMLYAAHVNHASMAAARLALERSDNAEVKELARRLIDTHEDAQQRLRQIAQADGVALPREPSRQQGYVIDALQGLDGQHFDLSFVRRIGVAEHRDALQRFHAQATGAGRDEQLARFAGEMLPRLQRVMAAAQSLHARLGPVAPGWDAGEIASAGAGPAKKLVEEAVESLDRMQDSPDAAQLLRRAWGVFVLPDYARAALGVGVQGGRGVLVARQGGTFSNPVFYDMSGLSIGLQAGASSGDVVFLLMTERALQQFRSDRNFSLNLDVAAAMGPYSAREQASTGKIQDVVVWSGTRGTFAGASLGVVNVRVDDELNRLYYGQPDATPLTILGGRVDNPHQNVIGQVLRS